jgi:FG-GAP repeat
MKSATRTRTTQSLVFGKKPSCFLSLLVSTLLFTASIFPAHAAELEASDGTGADQFGFSVSISGATAVIGAYHDDIGSNSNQGSAYLFRNLDSTAGTATENAKLISSDGAEDDFFGASVSVSATTVLVGAYQNDVGSNFDQGSVYLFRDVDTVSGTVTENAKLVSSDGAPGDWFGFSVSLSGSNALVGAEQDDGPSEGDYAQGSAYFFQNLDSASGTVTENAKLVASDGAPGDLFGYSVSLSGTNALVGAPGSEIGSNSSQGSAYYFQSLDGVSGTVTESAKLIASDGAAGDQFGTAVSLSGTTALVGAFQDTVGPSFAEGSAYLFRNLDSASGTVTENAKLVASDRDIFNYFGSSVSLSGTTALVGASRNTVGSNSAQGAAYLFQNLDTASGIVTEDVKLFASDGAASDLFGSSVAIDGDQFVVGAVNGDGAATNSGKAYSGTVSSVTTLDEGNSSRTIDGISFESRTDWIIGQTTDSNQVTLTSGDSGNVTAAGKAVYIGQQAGSDNNMLTLEGSLIANQIHIGTTGNTGNKLLLGGTGDRINDSAAISMSGGTFDTAGLSETVGALTLQNTSIIDLGDLSSLLRFADSSSLSSSWSGTLSIYDWSGDLSGGGTDQLYFGTDANGLTSSQLAMIYFYSGDGTGFLGGAQILSTGELVPVPEPTTIFAATLLGLTLLWRERRRLKLLVGAGKVVATIDPETGRDRNAHGDVLPAQWRICRDE